MKRKQGMMMYSLLIVLSLFIILFMGREVNSETGVASRTIDTQGWKQFKKGMDIAGGVRLHYKIDFSKYKEIYTNQQEYADVTRNIQSIILQNIDSRVSALGVSDYESKIQTLEDGQYVVIDLGGVYDLEEAKEIIGKTVELEFKTIYEGDGSEIADSRQLLAEQILKDANSGVQAFDELVAGRDGDAIYYQNYRSKSLEELPDVYRTNPELLTNKQPGQLHATVVNGTYSVVPGYSGSAQGDTILEGWIISKFNGSTTTAGSGTVGSGGSASETLYDIEDILVFNKPLWATAKDPKTNEILNGAFFKYAGVSQSQTGQPVVLINFDDKGKEIFCNITEIIVGEQLAIFVGGEMVTSPVIREKICGGTAQIDGQFDTTGAKELVDNLNAGALPAPLILANEEKVSASLGEKALQGAILAGGLGLLLVFTYMIASYGIRKGLVAVITILSFLIVLFAIIKLIGFALSLSGIAAILLSIGMGVDANVLIYERVNEELDEGKGIINAVVDGYERSRSAIRDGNLTTGMIALILFFIGTNVFKGFGTMMLVNIIITLTVLVPMTKYLLVFFLTGKENK